MSSSPQRWQPPCRHWTSRVCKFDHVVVLALLVYGLGESMLEILLNDFHLEICLSNGFVALLLLLVWLENALKEKSET